MQHPFNIYSYLADTSPAPYSVEQTEIVRTIITPATKSENIEIRNMVSI